MASLDFEQEKALFRKCYDSNLKQFADVRNASKGATERFAEWLNNKHEG